MPIQQLEQLVNAGQWETAHREVEWQLRFSDLSEGDRLRVLELSCRICNRVNEHYATMHRAEEALRLARRLGEQKVELLVRYDLGVAYLWLGNAAEAIECFKWFLSATDAENAEELGGKARFNLGIAYRLLGQWDQAVEWYKEAAGHYARQGIIMGQIKCLLETALCHLLNHNRSWAEWVLLKDPDRSAARLLTEYPDSYLGAQFKCLLAHFYLLAHDRPESEALARELMAGDHGPEIMADACWIAGENALNNGDYLEAQRLADMAIDFCKQCPFPTLVERAYSLLQRTREVLGERIV